MKKIKFTDITLREASAGQENSLSFKEVIETAKTLDRVGVDTICLAPIVNEKVDALLTRTITSAVKNSAISIPVGFTKNSAKTAWSAISDAPRKRLCVEMPVSAVQMEYTCKMKPAKAIEATRELVACCKGLCDDVEFAALDATRGEPDFLAQIIETAVSTGADTVTICDSAGKMLPSEFSAFINSLYEKISSLKNTSLSVRCSDELSMSAACAVSALECGASEICVAINGGPATSTEAAVNIIKTRGDDRGYSCGIKTTELHRSVNQINWLIKSKREKNNTPFDTGVKQTTAKAVKLDAKDDISSVAKAVRSLGYELSDEDLAKVFETFTNVAEKKSVGTKELEAIVASAAMQVPPTYKLVSFVINSGNIINATANIHFRKDGQDMFGLAVGDGPIDASFLAIEHITGHHYELDDFQIQAVTEGREAMGSSLIKLRSNGKLYSGNGISTDIIGSSIQAYLNALNKIAYEENHR
ncbi:MAG: alpha-isopropylmalate synthase regulatory domain-containing protein [Synergistaceae bacterium]|nr:alpha-isopropylmalate synthase regulatory domain-containing protein [Synergistaceae bacterium]